MGGGIVRLKTLDSYTHELVGQNLQWMLLAYSCQARTCATNEFCALDGEERYGLIIGKAAYPRVRRIDGLRYRIRGRSSFIHVREIMEKKHLGWRRCTRLYGRDRGEGNGDGKNWRVWYDRA